VSKKDKKISRANPYFTTEFYLFCLAHKKSQIFVKQLGSGIGCEDVHATFFLNFFKFFNNSKYV
jgi:hypothetical protein